MIYMNTSICKNYSSINQYNIDYVELTKYTLLYKHDNKAYIKCLFRKGQKNRDKVSREEIAVLLYESEYKAIDIILNQNYTDVNVLFPPFWLYDDSCNLITYYYIFKDVCNDLMIYFDINNNMKNATSSMNIHTKPKNKNFVDDFMTYINDCIYDSNV